jgi:hypothetical protein
MTTTNCTYTELANLTGSTLSQTVLEAIINQAEREVDSFLAPYGLSGSTAVKGATLHLSIAGLFTRYRLDGQKPGSLTLGDYTTTDNIDAAIATHRNEGNRLLNLYATKNTTNLERSWVVVVNE